MSAPDLTGYNQLTLYDGDSSSLVARALIDAAVKMPDWQPADGNTEVVLMEAHALAVDELRYAINRTPDGTAEVLFRSFGITRDLGAAPTGTATITLTDSVGHDLPAGVQLDLPVASGDVVRFTTDVAVSVPAGTATTTLPITATTPTAAANATATGTPLTVSSAIPYIDHAVLASIFAGSEPEDAPAWFTRATQQLQRLNQTLVLPKHFTAAALDFANVARATTIDNFNGTTTAPGHVTVAVLGEAGALLSAGDKTAIAAALSAQALSNLAIHVIDPTVDLVNVTTAVHAAPALDPTAVHDAVVAAIQDFLSTDRWPWSGTVRRNELITVIGMVDGVDYVETLNPPSGDVALSGAAPLAKAGTVTVTVDQT